MQAHKFVVHLYMSKSKTNKDRRDNVLKYKQSHKQKLMSKQQEQLLDPNVRPSPQWKGDQLISMFGAEWDAIFNFINSVGPAYSACSSVMNRGVLEGVVTMKFERVNPETGETTELTEAEQKPYQDQFAETIKQAKEIAAKAVKQAAGDVNEKAELTPDDYPSQEGLPVLDAIVDANGAPYQSEDKPSNPLKAV